mmetsp:Transcript_14309/g.13891  ORF Transcript_14309/g.13891 Transcript_14309/m.13891 type:complete len:88 (-) Transcript_14309:22-285(-)
MPDVRIAIYPPPAPCCGKMICYVGFDAVVNETEACMSSFDNEPELDSDNGTGCTYTCQSEGGDCFSDDDCHHIYNGGNASDYCCSML